MRFLATHDNAEILPRFQDTVKLSTYMFDIICLAPLEISTQVQRDLRAGVFSRRAATKNSNTIFLRLIVFVADCCCVKVVLVSFVSFLHLNMFCLCCFSSSLYFCCCQLPAIKKAKEEDVHWSLVCCATEIHPRVCVALLAVTARSF